MLTEKAEYKFYTYSVISALCKKSVKLNCMKLPFSVHRKRPHIGHLMWFNLIHTQKQDCKEVC